MPKKGSCGDNLALADRSMKDSSASAKSIQGQGKTMADVTAHITAIYRYPVKGLSPEPLDRVTLKAGETLPFDRAFAIENGGREFDEAAPSYLPKTKFLMLMRDERLATLRTSVDTESGDMTVLRDGKQVARGNLRERIGRQMLEQFFAAFMGDGLRGAPHIVHAEGHSFSDVAAKAVSIINLASIRDLERVIGRPVDPLRFRANVYIDGLAPWQEFEWLDKDIALGDQAAAHVFKRIQRCAATNVDPQTGDRDMQIPRALQNAFGHVDMGIYATVTAPGKIALGEKVAPVAAEISSAD
jgi:hypothetical protein